MTSLTAGIGSNGAPSPIFGAPTSYRDLSLGLVDAVVVAVAERKKAAAIATMDERNFGAVEIRERRSSFRGISREEA